MKNNKVRMNISREMHEWFTAIDGKTNDERMKRVIEVNEHYKQLLSDKHELNKEYLSRGQSLLLMTRNSHKYQELYYRARNSSRTLAGWLTVAITANFGFLVYVALTNGWFL